jgi:hypothetical protein
VPVKIVPLGRPEVPLPVIENVPPPAKVPPIARLPLLNAPVVKVRLPRLLPVTSPRFPKPLTAINVEPVRLRPELSPDSVPPLFVKSTELLANAVNGSARASRTIQRTRFIRVFLPNIKYVLICFSGYTAFLRDTRLLAHLLSAFGVPKWNIH